MIYLPFTYLITVHVGWVFYRNGEVYILDMFRGDSKSAIAMNKLLLTGYYLLNLGYATVALAGWGDVVNWRMLIEQVGSSIGGIVLLLAVMHYINLAVIALLSKKLSSSANATEGK